MSGGVACVSAPVPEPFHEKMEDWSEDVSENVKDDGRDNCSGCLSRAKGDDGPIDGSEKPPSGTQCPSSLAGDESAISSW